MIDEMYLIWSQLIIILFGALVYLSKKDYSVVKTQIVNIDDKNKFKKFTALFDFGQYFRTFGTVFFYTFIIFIILTFCMQFVFDVMKNINFNIIAYVHVILAIIIAAYITSRGVLKVTERWISITSIFLKKKILFEDIEFIQRIYTKDEMGVIDIELKNGAIYRIDLDSYKKTKELTEFVKDLFNGAQEQVSGEYTYKEEDKGKMIEIKNTVNFLLLSIIIVLNVIIFLVPEPNLMLGAIIILLGIVFVSNYRAHDIILKNGTIRYKLWIGSKYKSIKIENIKNIYLRDIAVNKKRNRAVSLVIYTSDNKTQEIPIFFAYKKRYEELIKLLN